jgi:hypothetical protein
MILALVIALAAAGAAMAYSKTVTLVNDTGTTLLEVCWRKEGADIVIYDDNLANGNSFSCTFSEANPSLYGRISGGTIEWHYVSVGDASEIYLQDDGSFYF